MNFYFYFLNQIEFNILIGILRPKIRLTLLNRCEQNKNNDGITPLMISYQIVL